MTEQTSRLAIILDSTGAEKNADSLASALNKITAEGEKAEFATDNLSAATKDLNSILRLDQNTLSKMRSQQGRSGKK
ncbi:hypothetical protein [Klebsiella variicola]|uniref:hypothetical protein n=1 Tax=Klebsiella variicola TaxID=244366 RepID=UPI001D18D39A|nr:hypothetical protein [Klebsiella variicola]